MSYEDLDECWYTKRNAKVYGKARVQAFFESESYNQNRELKQRLICDGNVCCFGLHIVYCYHGRLCEGQNSTRCRRRLASAQAPLKIEECTLQYGRIADTSSDTPFDCTGYRYITRC